MSTSRSLRLAVLLGLAVLYLAVYVASGRARRPLGLNPMAPEVRAVELALRDARAEPSDGAAGSRLDDAISLATSLTAAQPGEPFPTFLLATAYHRRGQWAAAAAAWERYVTQSTAPEFACPEIAVAYDRAGDPGKALASYRACAARDPQNPDRLADLATALASRAATDEARQVYDRAIALDPENPLLVAARAAVR